MPEYFDLARHFAIVTNWIGIDGLPIVVANSDDTDGPAEKLWSEFTQGRCYERAYYPSDLPPGRVLRNAYRLFGTGYDLFEWNCEHFANACHELPPRSEQVRTAVFAAVIGGLALAAART